MVPFRAIDMSNMRDMRVLCPSSRTNSHGAVFSKMLTASAYILQGKIAHRLDAQDAARSQIRVERRGETQRGPATSSSGMLLKLLVYFYFIF